LGGDGGGVGAGEVTPGRWGGCRGAGPTPAGERPVGPLPGPPGPSSVPAGCLHASAVASSLLSDPYLVEIIVYSLLLSPLCLAAREGRGHIFGIYGLPGARGLPGKGSENPHRRPWGETPSPRR